MAVLDLILRQLVGSNVLCAIVGFVELEAAIINATDIRHLSTLGDAADDPTMPFPGVVVAMTGSSEASSNFNVQVQKNGTPDAGVTMTVNSAKEYKVFSPDDYVSFDAGDTIGMYCSSDTTSKDFKGILYVVYDMSAVVAV